MRSTFFGHVSIWSSRLIFFRCHSSANCNSGIMNFTFVVNAIFEKEKIPAVNSLWLKLRQDQTFRCLSSSNAPADIPRIQHTFQCMASPMMFQGFIDSSQEKQDTTLLVKVARSFLNWQINRLKAVTSTCSNSKLFCNPTRR